MNNLIHHMVNNEHLLHLALYAQRHLDENDNEELRKITDKIVLGYITIKQAKTGQPTKQSVMSEYGLIIAQSKLQKMTRQGLLEQELEEDGTIRYVAVV